MALLNASGNNNKPPLSDTTLEQLLAEVIIINSNELITVMNSKQTFFF